MTTLASSASYNTSMMLTETLNPNNASSVIEAWTQSTLDQVAERYEPVKIQQIVDVLIKVLPPSHKLTSTFKSEVYAWLSSFAVSTKASAACSDKVVEMALDAVAEAITSRYTFRMCSQEDENELVMVRWKPVMHVPSKLEPSRNVHVGISCHLNSPFLRDGKVAREMMEYFVSTEKNVCVVIADTLNRFNMRAFERAKNMNKALRMAITLGDQFHKVMLDAKAEVESAHGQTFPKIQITRWDSVETETHAAQTQACISFYEENQFFRSILDDLARRVLESRKRDPNDAKKLDFVVQYILNELTHIFFGFRHQDILYREFLYPTHMSSLTDGVASEILGLGVAIQREEGFAPLLKELQGLGACTRQSGVQFYPLAM